MKPIPAQSWDEILRAHKARPFRGGQVLLPEFELDRLHGIEHTWQEIFRLCCELSLERGIDFDTITGSGEETVLGFIRELAGKGAMPKIPIDAAPE